MAQPAQQQTRSPDDELASLRAEIASLRTSFVDLARLVMPERLRNSYCGCGQLACSSVKVIRAGEDSVKQVQLCEDCKLDASWREVGRVELSPTLRETVSIANKLGCLRKPPSA
jgi:hypothetical protein